MSNFEILKNVQSNFDGYNFLSSLNYEFEKCVQDKIILDFSNNEWFEANLCAVLGAVIYSANSHWNSTVITGLKNKQKDIFSRNHFLATLGGDKISDLNNTTIKYRRNKLTDEKLIKEFLDRELINKPDFPLLSDAAKKEIIRSIFEIYNNAILHGNCENVFSCGQFYPNKNPPRIDFTIVDMGKTIKKNVNDFLQSDKSGIETIKWALQEKNTTKPKENNIPGGLGLKLIYDFVRLNNGKLQIVSSDGYWELTKDREKDYILTNPFPGTIVNIEFNLNDNSFYFLKNEIKETKDIIF